MLEISYIGATTSYSHPRSFIHSYGLTYLILETTFTNRLLFAYFWSLVSWIISGELTFDDFVNSSKYFFQHNACVYRALVLIFKLVFFEDILPKIFVASTITAVVPEIPPLKFISFTILSSMIISLESSTCIWNFYLEINSEYPIFFFLSVLLWISICSKQLLP